MNILIAYATRHGGTAEIARMIRDRLWLHGLVVDARPAGEVEDLDAYDAVIVGAPLYLNVWHRDARRFVKRHAEALRAMPVWFFSTGAIDSSASERIIPPVRAVDRLIHRVHARGHVTFGGVSTDPRIAAEYRDPRHIRTWADSIAEVLRPAVSWEPQPSP